MSAAALSSGNHLEEKLKERMQASLVDLLPEETIDAFVKKAVEDFTQDRVESAGYGHSKTIKSPMREMVENIVFETLRTKLAEALETRLAEAIPQSIAASDMHAATEKAIAALGPSLLNGVLAAMMIPMMNGLQQTIINNIRNAAYNGGLANLGVSAF